VFVHVSQVYARMMRRISTLFLLSVLYAGTTACVIRKAVEIEKVEPAPEVTVETSVRAHLSDGSIIVYPNGVSVSEHEIVGVGNRYDIRLQSMGVGFQGPQGWMNRVPLDSVLGMESYSGGVDAAWTAASTAAAGVSLVLACAALCGSCPTIYSQSGEEKTLEAEIFPYSIAPLFETRDIHRLQAQPGKDALLRLEVRNEMLETHYLNHFELLEIIHDPEERVIPDATGRPVALDRFVPLEHAVSRRGRDVTAELSDRDEFAYVTDQAGLEQTTLDDMEDWIELVFHAPAEADSVALLFRLRNSPLSTTLLYDVMLGPSGAKSLDWVGRDLSRIGPAVELGRWYHERMGLRIAIRDGEQFKQAARLGDVGPIAWKDVAVVVPVPKSDSLQVRLGFVADGWRIDQVLLAQDIRRPNTQALVLADVRDSDGASDSEALQRLRHADDSYVETTPGQKFSIWFNTGPTSTQKPRTFFLASQGYYIEWVRGAWIQSAERNTTFEPSDEALLEALQGWSAKRESYERRFHAVRFPTQ
jgi:hypothetical protein